MQTFITEVVEVPRDVNSFVKRCDQPVTDEVFNKLYPCYAALLRFLVHKRANVPLDFEHDSTSTLAYWEALGFYRNWSGARRSTCPISEEGASRDGIAIRLQWLAGWDDAHAERSLYAVCGNKIARIES
jgi:ribosome modulation factor